MVSKPAFAAERRARRRFLGFLRCQLQNGLDCPLSLSRKTNGVDEQRPFRCRARGDEFSDGAGVEAEAAERFPVPAGGGCIQFYLRFAVGVVDRADDGSRAGGALEADFIETIAW